MCQKLDLKIVKRILTNILKENGTARYSCNRQPDNAYDAIELQYMRVLIQGGFLSGIEADTLSDWCRINIGITKEGLSLLANIKNISM